MNSFEIKSITNIDIPEILKLARKTFYKDEPLNKSLKICESERDCEELDWFFAELIRTNYCIQIVDSNGILGGFLLTSNTPVKCNFQNAKLEKVSKFLQYAKETVNWKCRYTDYKNILVFEAAGVNPDVQAKGLITRMVRYVMDWANNNNIDLIVAYPSSFYTQKMFSKLDFEEISRIAYTNYCQNGLPVFNCEAPHVKLSIYVYDIKKNKDFNN